MPWRAPPPDPIKVTGVPAASGEADDRWLDFTPDCRPVGRLDRRADHPRQRVRPAGNLLVGVIGAFVGGVLFWVLGLTAQNLIGQVVTAVVGAVVALFIAAKLKNKA